MLEPGLPGIYSSYVKKGASWTLIHKYIKRDKEVGGTKLLYKNGRPYYKILNLSLKMNPLKSFTIHAILSWSETKHWAPSICRDGSKFLIVNINIKEITLVTPENYSELYIIQQTLSSSNAYVTVEGIWSWTRHSPQRAYNLVWEIRNLNK